MILKELTYTQAWSIFLSLFSIGVGLMLYECIFIPQYPFTYIFISGMILDFIALIFYGKIVIYTVKLDNKDAQRSRS